MLTGVCKLLRPNRRVVAERGAIHRPEGVLTGTQVVASVVVERSVVLQQTPTVDVDIRLTDCLNVLSIRRESNSKPGSAAILDRHVNWHVPW